MFKFIATYFLTLLASLALAQSSDTFKISGTVISLNSNQPIADATIKFTRTKGVLSDSLGHFIIRGLAKGQHKLSFSAFGYDEKDTTITITQTDIDDFKFVVYTACNGFNSFNREKAIDDIKKGKPKLLLVGGIAPVVYTTDKDFEEKFGITFYDFGCTPDRQECMLAYNRTVFAYLDKKFGKKWRSEIRKDVEGLR
jgi:hypothetical protein